MESKLHIPYIMQTAVIKLTPLCSSLFENVVINVTECSVALEQCDKYVDVKFVQIGDAHPTV